MTAVIFDRSLFARRRARALAERRTGADFLLTLAADDLADRLAVVDRHFSRALVVGDPTGTLAARIAAGRVDTVVRIPMAGGVDSLNVAAAAALAAWELRVR